MEDKGEEQPQDPPNAKTPPGIVKLPPPYSITKQIKDTGGRTQTQDETPRRDLYYGDRSARRYRNRMEGPQRSAPEAVQHERDEKSHVELRRAHLSEIFEENENVQLNVVSEAAGK